MGNIMIPGAPAPWFHAAALEGNPRYAFHSVGGRASVLLFLGSAGWPASAAAVALVAQHRALFDDQQACFFGVSIDPADVAQRRIAPDIPGIRWFIDHDQAISTLYGAADGDGIERRYRPHWLLLDRRLNVVSVAPIDRGEEIFAGLRALLATDADSESAPVLIVPRILEPEFCRRLIALHETHGGQDSGFMREENGITVGRIDHGFKRRSDCEVEDAALREALSLRIQRRLVPNIERAFQFRVTRIERWTIARYAADEGGFFRPHRDNTTKGTAHRRFACTINLNAEDYEGGDLRFPEFGGRRYRAPTGGAAIFSCSLLHEATPVTRGIRYAFLPFFYDDAGAALRAANLPYLSGEPARAIAPEAS